MKNTHSAPRWVRYGLPGIVAGFLVVLIFSAVSAATFTNPNCNPLEDLTCNPSSPLFLNPNGSAVVPPFTPDGQVIQTPVQISPAPGTTALDLYGFANLRTGGRINTPSAISGQAINVNSTDDDAIVGTSTGGTATITKAGIKGISSNSNGYGVYAGQTISGGYSLFADGSLSGRAAKFQGNTEFFSADSSKYAIFSIDNTSGALNINVAGGLKLNGGDVASSGVITKIFEPELGPGTTVYKEFVPSELFGAASNHYKLVQADALYALKGATNLRSWIPIPNNSTALTYSECTSSGGYEGKLKIYNPSATSSVVLRVVVGYVATPVECGGETTAPTIAWSPTPVGAVEGTPLTLSVDANDLPNPPGVVARVDFYDNGVYMGQDTSDSNAVPSHSLSIPRSKGDHVYLARVFDASGNSAEVSVTVHNPDVCNDTCGTRTCCPGGICLPVGQTLCSGGGGGTTID